RHGLSQFENRGNPGDYNEQDLGWNRVTPWGVFGIAGRYVNYFYNPGQVEPLDGRIYTGEASWMYPLYADFTKRLTLQVKADRTGKRLKLQDSVTVSSGGTTTTLPAGTEAQHQLYTSGEIGLAYGQNFEFISHQWSFEGAATVRKGFGNDKTGDQFVLANEGYLLYRPAVRLKFFWTGTIDSGIEGSGQITNTTVPEQQQWVLGGVGNLTSSLPGVAVGDKGYLARAFTEVALPSVYGVSFTPKIFVEQGGAKFSNPAAIGQIAGTQKLVDVGGELGFKFTKFVDGSFAYAHAFRERDISPATKDASKAQLYFRIAAKF
ncbi:MAG: hypothetical protein ACRETE_10305, partial [Stenotrophobium sp.]